MARVSIVVDIVVSPRKFLSRQSIRRLTFRSFSQFISFSLRPDYTARRLGHASNRHLVAECCIRIQHPVKAFTSIITLKFDSKTSRESSSAPHECIGDLQHEHGSDTLCVTV